MAKFLTKIPRVLVELPTGEKACRDKLQGIFRYAQLNGPWDMQVIEHNPYTTRLTSFENWKPDGRIIGCSKATELEDMDIRKIPVVEIDISDNRFKGASRIHHDSNKIAESIALFYLRQQFRHFAYIGAPADPDWSQIRADAFKQVIENHGFHCNIYKAQSRKQLNDWGLEQKFMQQWLKELPKPCGIMAALDLRARQVLDTCLICGIKVPEKLAVIGVDNDETICENTKPTLSSVLPDFEGAGYMAAELLDSLMRKTLRKPVNLSYGIKWIVHRQSSQHISKPNWIASQAKEFIRLNACMGITVKDVAKHLNVSRRLAELRFREACNYSILTEIQNQRLERVCLLLRETNLPIGTIGERCGYSTETYLKALFKKTFGMTMREYRKTT